MARIPITHRKTCTHEGCKEFRFSNFSSQREYKEWYKNHALDKWLCTRHTKPNEVLTLDNKEISYNKEYLSKKSNNYPNLKDYFWNGCNGFAHGDGWKAWTKDFPEGTVIQVETNVKVILPNQ